MHDKSTVALVLTKGHPYSLQLMEGSLTCLEEYPGPRIVEVPYVEGPDEASIVVPKEASGIIMWVGRTAEWVLDLHHRGVKIVSCSGEWVDEQIPTVACDRRSVAERVVTYFTQLGYPYTAYVGHLTSASRGKRLERDEFLLAFPRDRGRPERGQAASSKSTGLR